MPTDGERKVAKSKGFEEGFQYGAACRIKKQSPSQESLPGEDTFEHFARKNLIRQGALMLDFENGFKLGFKRGIVGEAKEVSWDGCGNEYDIVSWEDATLKLREEINKNREQERDRLAQKRAALSQEEMNKIREQERDRLAQK